MLHREEKQITFEMLLVSSIRGGRYEHVAMFELHLDGSVSVDYSALSMLQQPGPGTRSSGTLYR